MVCADADDTENTPSATPKRVVASGLRFPELTIFDSKFMVIQVAESGRGRSHVQSYLGINTALVTSFGLLYS